MPKECEEKPTVVDNDDSDNESYTEWSDEDEDDADLPSFPEFHRILTKSIQDLGGSVFPKLNWSAPRDAAWMGFANSLKCTTPSQALLLHDLHYFNFIQYLSTLLKAD